MSCDLHGPEGSEHPRRPGRFMPGQCFACEAEALAKYGREDIVGEYSETPRREPTRTSYPWQPQGTR